MSSPRLTPWLVPETIRSGLLADQSELGEAHAVDRGAVGREADVPVVEVDFLDRQRLSGW